MAYQDHRGLTRGADVHHAIETVNGLSSARLLRSASSKLCRVPRGLLSCLAVRVWYGRSLLLISLDFRKGDALEEGREEMA